jgi:glycosyltransferase involved in cell wall biosynthesis
MLNISSPIIRNTIYVGEWSIKSIVNERNQIKKKWDIKSDKKRVLFAGTHPIGQSNGYAKVVYYISKNMGKYEDIEFTIWGFQNFQNTAGGKQARGDIPSNIKIVDAFQIEKDKNNGTPRQGFGEKEIADYIKENPQDIIILFNDGMIVSAITATIINQLSVYRKQFKLICYMDQVYPFQKKDYIKLLNEHFDGIIAFTPYWKNIAYQIGIRKDMPIYSFPHGFDHTLYFPIRQDLARLYFELPENSFCVLNLNRNQPRKAFDISIIAWAKFVKMHYDINQLKLKTEYKTNKHTRRPIRYLIGTNPDGYWNLLDVLECECTFLDIPFEYAKDTLWFINNPQAISDRDVNILMNATDIGINTALGEGYGLCQSENLGVGKPQVASKVGGMQEFMDNTMSILIEPVFRSYHDNKVSSKGIGGIDERTNPYDFTDAMWKYFSNPDLVIKHGKRGRKNTLQHYKWPDLVQHFHDNILSKL